MKYEEKPLIEEELIIDFGMGKCSSHGCCKFASKQLGKRWVCEYHFSKLSHEIIDNLNRVNENQEYSNNDFIATNTRY